jgi:antitoxin component of MazEF toxin-antitoxin module
MKVKLRKVGNSYTVSIPKEFVSELGLTEGTDMNIFVREDAVVVEPATSRWDRILEEGKALGDELQLTEDEIQQLVNDVRYGTSEP